MTFKLIDEEKRIGLFKTKTCEIKTPFFMPVATRATGKSIAADDYKDLGGGVRASAIICNSLILSLKPGADIIKKAGGIHKFINFDGVIFTDCGGFQVSRNFFEKKTKHGLEFKNPYDKSKVVLTPQSIMKIQHDIGSDVAMVLDDMAPYGATYEEAKKAMENTHRWAKESLEAHKELEKKNPTGQKVFAIVQGNFYADLREESAKFLSSLDFDGFAIGGVAIGESPKEMEEAVKMAIPFLPKDKPRYVMGVGRPEDVVALRKLGVDCFDSVYPTMSARHSTMFTDKGRIYLDKGRYTEDFTPIEKGCSCKACKEHTRAYINHLSRIKEPTGYRLRSIHNLHYMMRLISKN
ncbi:MAG: tRNA guanosine(34) transglycosylase Tgt [Candidatus Woesearchaeota archaeon]